MLRNKGLTDKLLLLGIDGMDPRFTKRMISEGKMPNTEKLVQLGACREDLVLLGAAYVGDASYRLLSNDTWYYGF